MQNIVLYAVQNGAHRPLVSVAADDEMRNFKIGAAGFEFARLCNAQGVKLPVLQVVREDRETDAGGIALSKQTFTLLDTATFSVIGKSEKTLVALLPVEVPSADALKATAQVAADALRVEAAEVAVDLKATAVKAAAKPAPKTATRKR